MSNRPIRRVHTGDRVADDAQRSAQESAARLNGNPLSDGRLLTEEPGAAKYSGLKFVGGVTRSIAHGLDRKALGFFEVYGASTPSVNHVGLRAVTAPSATPVSSHITVSPDLAGTCWIFVF